MTDRRYYRATPQREYKFTVPRGMETIPGRIPLALPGLSGAPEHPTEGPPLVIEGGIAGFYEYPMVSLAKNVVRETASGDDDHMTGCWTGGRSDCVVVLAVQAQPRAFFFVHLDGGMWEPQFDEKFRLWIDAPDHATIVLCSNNVHNESLLRRIDPHGRLAHALFYATLGSTFALNTTETFWGRFGEIQEA